MMETIRLADWQFTIDREATRRYTMQCSTDHCLCPYCRNFYENADPAQPRLRQVLSGFGAFLDGPCEVMPLQHNVILAAYRITGEILRKGHTELFVDDVPLIPEKYEIFKKMTPTNRRMFGCYLYNFGENKQATGEAVKWQLDWYRERIIAGEAEGVVLHTNTMADLDFEAYDVACKWMEEHGEEDI
jgi:hypothetical protein